MRHVGSGTRERFPRRVSTTFRQFKAPSSPSPVLHPRRRSTAYLIKAYWSRYAYNRINCFWCESTRDLAMLSALWKVSHSSLRLSSTYIYIYLLSNPSWNILPSLPPTPMICNIVTRKTKYDSYYENSWIDEFDKKRYAKENQKRDITKSVSLSREIYFFFLILLDRS